MKILGKIHNQQLCSACLNSSKLQNYDRAYLVSCFLTIAASWVCWGIFTSMLGYIFFLYLHINIQNKNSHPDAGHKHIHSPCKNYKLLMSGWIISPAMSLYRHTACVVQGGCYMYFCEKTPVTFTISVWTLPIFANLPFHVFSLWLRCFWEAELILL